MGAGARTGVPWMGGSELWSYPFSPPGPCVEDLSSSLESTEPQEGFKKLRSSFWAARIFNVWYVWPLG